MKKMKLSFSHKFTRSFRLCVRENVRFDRNHTERCFCFSRKLNLEHYQNGSPTTAILRENIKSKVSEVPSFHDFIRNQQVKEPSFVLGESERVPYLEGHESLGKGRKVYFDVHGCQMNVNDTEVVWSILRDDGFDRVHEAKDADVVLVMTCAIREGAEGKIWEILKRLKSLRQKKNKALKIGVIGCMAERLKEQILEKEKSVNLVCGPDAYRDLPRMLAVTDSGQTSVNVLLSLDETYADIMPVRLNEDSCTAYVSITRGCDNMCSYCIVPFTRGRERSRPMSSILDEVRKLSDEGVKEVTLLGQNVNSYRDTSEASCSINPSQGDSPEISLSRGFKTIYRPKKGGRRFSDLLDKVSLIDPEMRIRFTSPHPKDFPDEVLHLIKERPNICNCIHIPAQSGSTKVLQDMRRGHTREAYLDLVRHIRSIIPDVALTSDFIAGFCGETEEDHRDTISLIQQVRYDYAFIFAYSMRKKTHAYHKLQDDVPENTKKARLEEIRDTVRNTMLELNTAQIGQAQVVLVTGNSKRSKEQLKGRNDGNTKVIIPKIDIPEDPHSQQQRKITPGDYVMVQITNASSEVLHGTPLYHTTLQGCTNPPDVQYVQLS